MASKKPPPQTLVHFTSSADGSKNLETEIVKAGSASAQFLKRMEQHQLHKPCYRIIDFRDNKPDDLFEYEYQGIIHYLDSRSIELFENLLIEFHYVYTQEIYDMVRASFKPVAKKESIAATEAITSSPTTAKTKVKKRPQQVPLKSSESLTIIPFGYHLHQHEIRMLYVSPIKIYNKIEQRWITAKTMNLSISGLKVKLETASDLAENETISIHFTGLNKQFEGEHQDLEYEIIEISYFSDYQILRLVRIDNQNDELFISALSKFIKINHRRYKIDLDDFIASVKSKYLERQYTQCSQYQTLFFHDISGQIEIKHLLSNQFFKANNRIIPIISEMKSAFSQLEFKPLSKLDARQQKLTNIYSFTLTNATGDEILYSALDSDFSDLKEKQDFIKIALASKTYKGWHLLISQCRLLSENTAAGYLSELEDVSIEEATNLQQELASIFATGILVDNYQSINLQYNDYNFKNPDSHEFPFEKFECHIEQDKYIASVKIAQQKQRNENRYFITTSVIIEFQGKEYNGVTLDFSPSGMKVKLEQSLKAEIRDSMDITFPGLQKKFKKEQLTKQHFRIVHISKKGRTVCFSRDRRFVLHEASIFFRRLIDSNLQKLTQCSGDTYMVVRSALFENLNTQNLQTIPFFIQTKNKTLKADFISSNENPTPLLWDFKSRHGYNFNAIFSSPAWIKIMASCSKNNINVNDIYTTTIYLYKKSKQQNWQISIAEDFKTFKSQYEFVRKLKKLTLKKILQISITPTNKYDDNYILDEINEIRNNSINQSDNLQLQLNNIKALGELVDVTKHYFSE